MVKSSWFTVCVGVAAVVGCNAPASGPVSPTPSAVRETQAVAPQQNGRPRRGRPAADAQAGEFDFYLLNLSWSPEFCFSHPDSPECATHPGFVVHGLWPQNDDGTYPEHCSDAPGPTNPAADTDLMPTVSLVEHEWTTHGTCSGMAAEAYFATVRKAFHEIAIPRGLVNVRSAETLTPQAILQEFAAANPSLPAGAFALSCGNNYLTAVEVCLTKGLAGEACPNVQSCGAAVVKVTPQ